MLVRDWLNDSVSNEMIPSGSRIADRYHLFEDDLPLYSETFKKVQRNLHLWTSGSSNCLVGR